MSGDTGQTVETNETDPQQEETTSEQQVDNAGADPQGQAQTSTEKLLPQSQVDKLAGTARQEGRSKGREEALAELATRLGLSSPDELEKLAEERQQEQERKRQEEDAKKSESERLSEQLRTTQQQLEAEKQARERAEAEARAQAQRLDFTAAAARAGIPADRLDDAYKLSTFPDPDADGRVDYDAVAKGLIEARPWLIGAGETATTPSTRGGRGRSGSSDPDTTSKAGSRQADLLGMMGYDAK